MFCDKLSKLLLSENYVSNEIVKNKFLNFLLKDKFRNLEFHLSEGTKNMIFIPPFYLCISFIFHTL